MDTLRILMLEDNPADAELIQFELQEAGLACATKVVMTEKDFVRELLEFSPGLILSDYDLPEYTGALALSEANKRCPDVPFILVTGAVTEERAIEILTGGAKDYVMKGRLQRLVPAILRVMAEAEEHKARKKAEEDLLKAHRSLEEKVRERTVALQEKILEQQKTERELRLTHERLEVAQRAARVGMWDWDLANGDMLWSAQMFSLFGLDPLKTGASFETWKAILHPEDRERAVAGIDEALREHIPLASEYRIVRPDGQTCWISVTGEVLYDNENRPIRLSGTCADISGLRRIEQERNITIEFLRLINESHGTRALIESATTFFQKQSGCQAVGVRLKEGDDYPYFEVRGFTKEFVLLENSLCTHDLEGQVIRDGLGNPVLDCMCGNVICGRFDPSKSFFTENGSFWSNGTTELLASTSEADRQARTRNRCNGEGYESVALLPLVCGEERLGLLQLNDMRKGVFSPELIALWERLAGYLAVALAKSLAEEKLNYSEARYGLLFKNMPGGYSYCRMLLEDGHPRDFIYIDVNPAFEALTGLKNVAGQRVTQAVPGILETNPELLEIYGRVALAGKPERFETYVPPLGRWFAVSAFSPAHEYFVAVFENITDRKQAEEIQRRDSETARRLAGEMAIIAGIGRVISSSLDIDDVYERFAAEARKLIPFDGVSVNLKKPHDDTLTITYVSGVSIDGRKPGDTVPITGTFSEAVVRTRTARLFLLASPGEMTNRYPGVTTAISVREGMLSNMVVPLFSQDAVIGTLHFRAREPNAYTEQDLRLAERIGMQIAGAIANARLFSDLKKIENSLRESEERFRLAYQTSPDAININRMEDGLYVDANEGFTWLTGFTREEVIGKTSREIDIWCDPADRLELVRGLTEKGYYENLEADFRRRDGSITTALMSARIIVLHGIPHILSITRDISERKRAEAEHRAMEEQLFEAQKMEAMGTLAGGIAHDFNNILGAIIGHAELAEEEHDEQVRKRSIDQVLKAAARAKNLIRQILAFSRHTEHEKKPIDLRNICKETMQLLSSTIPSTIEIRTNITDKPCIVTADPSQMHQILMNLCTNATHAMGERGGILDVNLTHAKIEAGRQDTDLKPGSYARLTVSDTGHGIDPAIISRIFDPFFTTKSVGTGTGLGLSVVYGIVKHHDGAITVASKPGEGSTFSIDIPCVAEAEPVDHPQVVGSIPKGDECILLVDDEKVLVDLGQRMLCSLGYEVTAVTDSREALRIFRMNPGKFDLVITDMTMPHMAGSDLAKEIIKEKPDTPIILCTGFNEFMNAEKALDMGIRALIMKPLSRRDLGNIVRETLNVSAKK